MPTRSPTVLFFAPSPVPARGVPQPWSAPRRAVPPRRPRTVLARACDGLRKAWRRHATRRALADLDPFLLKDIGVTFAEAEQEANKPFWVE